MTPPREGFRWYLLVFLALLGCLAYRITLGLDLSDEAYYAAFVDEWLKVGLGHGFNLPVHQTAELWVYPFAWIYAKATGGEAGIVLFMRALYLALAAGGAFSLFRLGKRLGGRLVAGLAAAYLLLFIPFSLPAPSYDTIGCFGLLSALCWWGVALLRKTEGAAPDGGGISGPMAVSACCWMVATVAYPTLLAALAATVALSLLLIRRGLPLAVWGTYVAFCAAFQVAGLALLYAAFGGHHLVEMVRFTDFYLGVSTGMGAKAVQAWGMIVGHPFFLALVLLALAVAATAAAASRPGAPKAWGALALLGGGALLLGGFGPTPVLFIHAHDLVLLLALAGLYIPWLAVVRPTATSAIAAVLYGSSLAAGMVTAATASNGLATFPLGGCLASCLALALFPAEGRALRSVRAAWIAAAALVMGWCAFSFLYGEVDGKLLRPSRRIAHGAYAGLLTSRDQAHFLAEASRLLAVDDATRRKVVVLGRLPGFYLLSPMQSSSFLPWNWSLFGGRIDQFIEAFYAIPAHQPDYIAVYSDPWSPALTSSQTSLLRPYRELGQASVGYRRLTLYGR